MPIRAKLLTFLGATLLLCALGCQKEVHPSRAATPLAAIPTRPLIELFTAEPRTVIPGQLCYLRWSVAGTGNVQIDNDIGRLAAAGTRSIYPRATATFTLTASNATGTAQSAVTVAVSRPLPSVDILEGSPDARVDDLLKQLQDIHFDDRNEIRSEDRSVLDADVLLLKKLFTATPNSIVLLEGHSDDVEPSEYSLAVGDRRASIVKSALIELGMAEEKLQIVSYGKEYPLCTDGTQICSAQNRRVHFSRPP